MDEWIDSTTMHDPVRVLRHARTGKLRTEPFDPPSPDVQERAAALVREIEAKEAGEPQPAGEARSRGV